MLWVHSFLQDIGGGVPLPMEMCNNKVVILIANNIVFHYHTKHIDANCCFSQDLLMMKQIATPMFTPMTS